MGINFDYTPRFPNFTGWGEEKSNRIQILHNRFVDGTITDKEHHELYEHFSPLIFNEGYFERNVINEFLYASHPDYGKPDKKGKISII